VAARYGGGIRVQGDKATLLIKNSTVSGNVAGLIGGGIHSDNRSGDPSVNAIVIDNSEISGNWTTTMSLEIYDHGKGGGIYSVGLVTIGNGSQITGNGKNDSGDVTTLYGGGIYSVGKLQVSNSAVSGNAAAEDGGGIYVYNFNRLEVNGDVTFSGNTAGNAYWLDAYENTGIYNTDLSFLASENTEITVFALKALHGPDAPIKTMSFSAAPDGNIKPFNYLANNYDLNFNGSGLQLLLPHLNQAPHANYGTGILPTRRTLYGLNDEFNDGIKVAGSVNHVVNPDAQQVTDLTFTVANPLSGDWSLELHCTTFVNEDSSTGAAPVAVNRNGVPQPGAFSGGSTITVYDSTTFAADLLKDKASIDGSIGTWNWSRLQYDIKAEAEPGKQVVDEYQSVFTWTLITGP